MAAQENGSELQGCLLSPTLFNTLKWKISRRPIFAEFHGQYQSTKIKIREIFSYFFLK